MDNVYVYLIDMPNHVRESVVPCADGYTVYIDKNISQSEQLRAYNHAMLHIIRKDFERDCADEIEADAHSDAL